MPQAFPSEITINNESRESITNVLFQLDPELLDSIARTFYDSHIEVENGRPQIVANARIYKCPVCGERYDKNLYAFYAICEGTPEHKHERVATEPEDWHPMLTATGFNFIIGAIKWSVNSNLATGNYGEMRVRDVRSAKEKLNLEKQLLSNAHKMACFMINTLLGNIKLYINPEYYTAPRKISNLFTYSFVYEFVLGMSRNIYSVLSKGKGLEAVNAIATNRLVYEEHAQHEQGYTSSRKEEERKSFFDKLWEETHGIK